MCAEEQAPHRPCSELESGAAEPSESPATRPGPARPAAGLATLPLAWACISVAGARHGRPRPGSTAPPLTALARSLLYSHILDSRPGTRRFAQTAAAT